MATAPPIQTRGPGRLPSTSHWKSRAKSGESATMLSTMADELVLSAH
jgi:hypothetical protein